MSDGIEVAGGVRIIKTAECVFFVSFSCFFSLTCIAFEPIITATIHLPFPRNTSSKFQPVRASAASERYLHNQSLHQTYYTKPCLHVYSADQLKAHFTAHGYSQEQILRQHTLYMNPEFIKLIKTYSGYEQYITWLNKKLQKKWGIAKWFDRSNGKHKKGLTKRVAELYKELEREREHERALQNLVALRAKHRGSTIVHSTGIDAATLLFASHYGISEQQLRCGTMSIYERQLHQEFITQLFQASQLTKMYKDAPSYTVFLDALGQGAALGIEANQSHNSVAATKWADYGWAVLDIIKGIGEGVILGACNTTTSIAHTVLHPIQTAHQIVHGIGTIAYFLARATGAALTLERLVESGDYTTFAFEAKNLSDQLNTIAHHCTEKLALMSQRELAKRAVAFSTELVLTGKLFTMAHNICSRLVPLALDAITILRNEQITVELTVATAEGLQETSSLMAFMEKEPALEKTAQVIAIPAPRIVSKSTRIIVPTWIDIKSLMKKFEGRCIYKGQSICVDYEHLFSIGEICKIKRSGHITDPRLYGWHHDYMKALEKSGVVQYENTVVGSCGSFRAEPVIKGIKYGKKTFFSSSWTEEQVVEKVLEAMSGAHISCTIDSEECEVIKALTRCGLEMQIIYDPRISTITTAFPIIE